MGPHWLFLSLAYLNFLFYMSICICDIFDFICLAGYTSGFVIKYISVHEQMYNLIPISIFVHIYDIKTEIYVGEL